MIGRICIDALMVDCVIGCLPEERTTPQTVRVDVWFEMDVSHPADTDTLRHTWDYVALSRQIAFILKGARFHLLESASRMLLRYLLLPPAPDEARPPVVAASVALTKFGVLPGEACPRLQVTGTAASQVWRSDQGVDIVDESRRVRLARSPVPVPGGLPIAGGAAWLAITHTA